MKRWLKVLIIVIILLVVAGLLYYIFSEVTPYDDTKKLYIKCNNNHKSYSVLSSDDITFASKDDKCKLDINVRNVDRNYIKLKTTAYFYGTNTYGEIDDSAPYNDIYVEPGKTLVLYSYDKTTKFEFEYK